MSTQTPSEAQASTETTQAPAQAKDIGSPDLTFAEYETLRRGGSVDARAEHPSAPTPKGEKEQNASEKSDPSETETKEDEKAEKPAPESDEDEDADDLTEKPKKKGGFQRRIDKLNARYTAAQAEIEHWKAMALKGAGESKPEPKVDAPTKADDAGKPQPGDFETHQEYVEALTDWKLEQREATATEKARQEKLKTEQQQIMNDHAKRVDDFAKKHDDWADVIAEADDVQLSPTVMQVFTSSENGPALMYELAKNRAELERISKLPPLAAALELGKVEAKIVSRASEAAKPETKKITQAPKPIEPVGGTKSAVKKSIDDPEISFAEYERLRREQMRRRGA